MLWSKISLRMRAHNTKHVWNQSPSRRLHEGLLQLCIMAPMSGSQDSSPTSISPTSDALTFGRHGPYKLVAATSFYAALRERQLVSSFQLGCRKCRRQETDLRGGKLRRFGWDEFSGTKLTRSERRNLILPRATSPTQALLFLYSVL